MRNIHIANERKRDATVAFAARATQAKPTLGLPGHELDFRRYLAATATGLHEALVESHGGDYGQALVEGDPEIDLEQVGRAIEDTQTVYLSHAGEVLHVSPRTIEVLFDTEGNEKERREPVDALSNCNEEAPLAWTGRKLSKSDAVRKFAFRRTIMLQHVDGLTFDFLFGMATELANEDVLVMLGGGSTGKSPLIFQDNGKPYRGFLEGRVDGERYKLMLHLSDMELRMPEETST